MLRVGTPDLPVPFLWGNSSTGCRVSPSSQSCCSAHQPCWLDEQLRIHDTSLQKSHIFLSAKIMCIQSSQHIPASMRRMTFSPTSSTCLKQKYKNTKTCRKEFLLPHPTFVPGTEQTSTQSFVRGSKSQILCAHLNEFIY